MSEHGWFEIAYSYATFIECECGFRPSSQQEMDAHIPAAEVRSTDTIRCDYCGDDLPSVKSREHIPTTPNLQRLGFAADKVVCPECVARARSTDTHAHDLDRMGICRRCGQGITAKKLLDGEERCDTTNHEIRRQP